MPTHVNFSHGDTVATFELSGEVHYEELREMMFDLSKRPILEVLECKIIDLTRLEWLSADRQQFVELSMMEREIALRAPKCAVAIQVSSDYARGLASMWASLIQLTGFRVCLFDVGQDTETRMQSWLDVNRPRRRLSPA